MVHYKSIDQSQFAEGTDIKEQEKVFDDFLQESLLEIQGSHINNHSPIPYIFLKTCNRSEIYYGEGEVPDEVALMRISVFDRNTCFSSNVYTLMPRESAR